MATVTLLTNPRKRTRRKTAKRKTTAMARSAPARRSNPRRRMAATTARRRVARRRNPIKKGVVDTNIMPSLKGAVGAVAVDTLYDMAPIPSAWQVGAVGHGVKALFAIGAGMVAENMKLANRRHAVDMVNGALTVQFAGLVKEVVGATTGAIGTATTQTETAAGDNTTGYISAAPPAGRMMAGDGGMGIYDTVPGEMGMYEGIPGGY